MKCVYAKCRDILRKMFLFLGKFALNASNSRIVIHDLNTALHTCLIKARLSYAFIMHCQCLNINCLKIMHFRNTKLVRHFIHSSIQVKIVPSKFTFVHEMLNKIVFDLGKVSKWCFSAYKTQAIDQKPPL